MATNRRDFLRAIGLAGAASFAFARGFTTPDLLHAATRADDDDSGASRLRKAKQIRDRASALAFRRRMPTQKPNGEEKDYPYIATFTKGLPHNDLGEVDKRAYKKLLKALTSQKQRDFENIETGDKRLKNPMAGLTYHLEGPDPQQLALPAAPRIDEPENSAEMGELYWQALCRDIPFLEYENSATISEAIDDLSRFTRYKGPKAGSSITPSVIFRGTSDGCLVGPYISQFLWLDVPMGVRTLPGQLSSGTLSQRYRTTLGGTDYLTSYAFWQHRNSGGLDGNTPQYDSGTFYIRNGRDLAGAVQIDIPFQSAVNAAYIILSLGIPYGSGNPYRSSLTMDPFSTFGYPHVVCLVGEAALHAAHAVWYQKWFVHRRLRPETFAARIYNHLRGAANYSMIDSEILNSNVLPKIADYNLSLNGLGESTYLLPQAYPEGAPLHPAYASGHAAMIGAAVTVLKAFFDESFAFPNPVVTNSDGTALLPYSGTDASLMTVGGELNKLAYNIAMGRNWAGIHWRTDASEGLKLGETVAIRLLKELSLTFPEKHSYSLTTFTGKRITIRKR
ncbi:MAG: vanadium-dependent haloperoxidase [Deltaproteobacteria bacterium]|nr:vanadium-dependent haloperoxidase [Deltaproteobacteria bacterium]